MPEVPEVTEVATVIPDGELDHIVAAGVAGTIPATPAGASPRVGVDLWLAETGAGL